MTPHPAAAKQPQNSIWWAEASDDNLAIVLELICLELEDAAVPPLPAAELAEDLVSLALTLHCPPSSIKLWLSDEPSGVPSPGAYRRWVERWKLTGTGEA